MLPGLLLLMSEEAEGDFEVEAEAKEEVELPRLLVEGRSNLGCWKYKRIYYDVFYLNNNIVIIQ